MLLSVGAYGQEYSMNWHRRWRVEHAPTMRPLNAPVVIEPDVDADDDVVVDAVAIRRRCRCRTPASTVHDHASSVLTAKTMTQVRRVDRTTARRRREIDVRVLLVAARCSCPRDPSCRSPPWPRSALFLLVSLIAPVGLRAFGCPCRASRRRSTARAARGSTARAA